MALQFTTSYMTDSLALMTYYKQLGERAITQVADAQLRLHEDTLKVLAVGRQTMAMQLNERLQSVEALPD